MKAAIPYIVSAMTCFADVLPYNYLTNQPKPNFAVGHHLPHLTRWGWTLSSNACVELAKNWGYAIPLLDYATLTTASNCSVVGHFNHGMTQLASNNPTQFKLSILMDRTFYSPPTEFYSTNTSGQILSNGYPIVSPEGSDAYWSQSTSNWMKSIAIIQTNAPISAILNGGEYGLDVAGFGAAYWKQDPRISATNGYSVPRYSSNRKAHQLGFLTTAIHQQVPNRELYIFYHTGNEQNRYTILPNWFDAYALWGWNSDVMDTNTDLPSMENYFNTLLGGWGWQTNPYPNEILTRHLNGIGYSLSLGYTNNYSWVNGGNHATDPTRLSDIGRYTGFLKCLYTSGMVGGIAGYFIYPSSTNNGYLLGGPGFDAPFPPNSPPHWLLQITALAHTHALFSHLENFLWNGDLLSGPQSHIMSTDQPAYEFPNTNADITARVLSRKMRTSSEWLITAWAESGSDRNVSVTIPTLGTITVTASSTGSVYYATSPSNMVLLDEYSFPASSSISTVNVQTAIFR